MIWAARAWREERPRQALALAQEAAALMQPRAPDDDNVSRRWWLALALGEQALALQQAGEAANASAVAHEAMALWQLRPPAEGPPPALLVWVEPLRMLLPK